MSPSQDQRHVVVPLRGKLNERCTVHLGGGNGADEVSPNSVHRNFLHGPAGTVNNIRHTIEIG